MNENTLLEARQIIAGFLKNRREELGMSQQALADLCGFDVGTISRMERALYWLGMKQYLIICHHLKLFPLVSTMEEESDIADALRTTWVQSPSISIEKAQKLLDILKAKQNSNFKSCYEIGTRLNSTT